MWLDAPYTFYKWFIFMVGGCGDAENDELASWLVDAEGNTVVSC